MKTYCLKQLMYFRFHEDQRLIRGTSQVVRETSLLFRKKLNFLFLPLVCVFWDQGEEEKVNYINVKSESISSIKSEYGGFLCFFFSSFVIESSVFEVESLHWKPFLCCSVLEFRSFPHAGFVFVCKHGFCSTVTGLRYCGQLRETDIKLSLLLLLHFWEMKTIQW